ncbi:MAG: low molecular weight phosphotyrosine protein phosphatase [Clostridiales bacterium]|nr:low molecular weight phosphotyrosine protein phosphatase [Clostridiales bacterium]
MIKIMFVCHGNICRSPMAEFLMKDLVEKKGESDKFLIKSSATSSEELGNPVHRGTRGVLDRLGISYKGKYAVKLTAKDYNYYDYFIGMDAANLKNMQRIFGGDPKNKISLLLSYAGENRDVADPWWTGNFEETYRDVSVGVDAFYKALTKNA